jgi:alpha-tubulin suppressor-like RCC1 family protein
MNKLRKIAPVLLLFTALVLSCTTKFKEQDAGDVDAGEDPSADDVRPDSPPDGPDLPDDIEIPATCGNGVTDEGEGEECDDGQNGDQTDGCTDACTYSCHDAANCTDGQRCNGEETCDTGAHRCQPGEPAGEGEECETDTLPCTRDVCDGGGRCIHPVEGAFCRVDDTCVDEGTRSPDNQCLACIPTASREGWSDYAGALCDDGAFCTLDDQCRTGGICEGPGRATDLFGVVKVATGGRHTCAVVQMETSDAVKCWGANDHGQLGNGTNAESRAPIDVAGLVGVRVTALTAGSDHTCVLLDTGEVLCWGYNGYGQLGNGSTVSSNVPLAVTLPGGETVTSIASGQNHNCLLTAGRYVYCWGFNEFGQVGDGVMPPPPAYPTPTRVNSLAGTATAVDTGGNHACALNTDGTVQCWGANDSGQLGNDRADLDVHSSPIFVAEGPGLTARLTGVQSIALGFSHSCARMNGSWVKCWGWNFNGQLGVGSNNEHHAPVFVQEAPGSDLVNVSTVAPGGYHTCAVMGDTRAMCWGKNMDGQLGNGFSGAGTDRLFPVEVKLDDTTAFTGVWAMDAQAVHTCAIINTNQLFCWGDNASGQLGTGIPDDEAYPAAVACGP